MHEADASPLNLLALQQEVCDRLTRIHTKPLTINMLDAEQKKKAGRKVRKKNSRGTDHNYLTGKMDKDGTHPVLDKVIPVSKSLITHLPDVRTEKHIVNTVVDKSCKEPFMNVYATKIAKLAQLRKIIADSGKETVQPQARATSL